MHNSLGVAEAAGQGAALTSLGYSGEHFDAKAQQQYLRARFYNPANGRFNRLDPFAGNMQDPQSLHKYAYVHGDPIGGVDPSGRSIFWLYQFITAGSQGAAYTLAGFIYSVQQELAPRSFTVGPLLSKMRGLNRVGTTTVSISRRRR